LTVLEAQKLEIRPVNLSRVGSRCPTQYSTDVRKASVHGNPFSAKEKLLRPSHFQSFNKVLPGLA
jgi:hypothetical protein